MHHHTVLLATFSHLQIINSKHGFVEARKTTNDASLVDTMSLQLLGNELKWKD
jgi:hypothetical protein